ncbi:hypothetical protein DQ04_03001000 [Trypanosoma grayi]|uniref:hypothetical protein n=1 Tax=Trypanosoma grayi TaxID=71804 RepID=UPI0004F49C11|nr:hypothetical protein DQ04_03001000 [Trypanosoma grayi]KEG11075.1 hypothetical protein DQ04_03001000 [Trypanosoma grayi]
MSLTEMYFRRCFEGVQSYQEARGLHQRLVQQLLVVRAAEERSGGDSNASAPEFRAAHWLGKLEDAYHDWLVDHLGIKSRQRQSTDQPLLSTVTVTIEESTQLESGRGATPVPVKCGAGAGTGTTPLSPNLPSSSDRLETALAYGRSVPLTSNEASAARGGTTPPVAGVTMVPSESAAKNRVDSAAADASHEATPPSPALAEAESAAVVKGDSVAAAPFTPSVTGAVLGLKQNEEEEEQQQQQHEEKQKQCPEENGGAVSRRRAGRAFLFLREQLC